MKRGSSQFPECCKDERKSDTGKKSSGLHTHPRTPNQPLDHATGTNFCKDQSTTKAVWRRMQNIFYYLHNQTPPSMDQRPMEGLV